MPRRLILPLLALTGGLLIAAPAAAQGLDLAPLLDGGDGSLTGRLIQIIGVITVLSIAPGLLIMVTSFTRLVIVFSFMRSGLGLQQTPPNMVLISLALFVTAYVMAPTFDEAWRGGLRPLLNEQITEEQAFERIASPFRGFMLNQVREKDLAMFEDLFGLLYQQEAVAPTEGTGTDGAALSGGARGPTPLAALADSLDLRVLIPAFMVSELRRAFEIGFLIFLPFLVIDIVTATVLMSMGMMMLPPVIISLPFKIVFFVLIDGWHLLTAGLVRSFL